AEPMCESPPPPPGDAFAETDPIAAYLATKVAIARAELLNAESNLQRARAAEGGPAGKPPLKRRGAPVEYDASGNKVEYALSTYNFFVRTVRSKDQAAPLDFAGAGARWKAMEGDERKMWEARAGAFNEAEGRGPKPKAGKGEAKAKSEQDVPQVGSD
ncbi:hypothetical protein TeGR_g9167, partial [Tetraparma gracilis]